MNLCITPRSIKLLGTYFKNNLLGIVDNNKSYEDIQRELFDKALSDFQTPETKVRDKELIIQHLAILPQIVSQYLGETPSVNNEKLFTRVNTLRSSIYEASQSTTVEDFQQIIDDITNTLGIGSMVITDQGPISFNAISFVFAKTASQEAIYNNLTGYSSNVTDPRKDFEVRVQQNLIKSGNPNNYQLKMITVGEALANSDLTYFYDTSDSNRPLVIIVNDKGDPVKFDEQGNESPTGKIPGIPIRTQKAEFEYAVNTQVDVYVSRGQMLKEGAEKFVRASLQAHLDMLERASDKLAKGQPVLFDINLAESNLGFTELNASIQTPLRSITNLEESEVYISAVDKSNFAMLNIPNSNSPAKIFSRPLDTLEESQIGSLVELFTNPNLTLDGAPLSIEDRQKLITTFIQFKSKSQAQNNFGFSITHTPDGNMISSVVLGDKRFSVAGKDFESNFRKYISEFKGFPFNGPQPSYTIVEGIENVTFQNQVYTDNGIKMIARKPEISFGLYRGVNMDVPVRLVQSIQDNAIVLQNKERGEYIKDHGYTIVVPNAEGKVRGYSAYLSFSSTEDRTTVPKGEDFSFFTSVSELNSRTQATEKEEKQADRWWKDSPLSKGIKIAISDQVHVKGRKYLADFVGDTISLYAGSDKTDVYHEAFHAFTQSILSSKEREDLYDAIRGIKGSFGVTVHGTSKSVNFKDATNLEVEEYLATEFKDYAKGRSKHTKTSAIGRFFQRLLEALQKFFGNYTVNEVKYLDKFGPEVNAIFNDLFEGNVDMSKFESPTNEMALYSSIEVSDNINLSNQELHLTMSSMQGLMTRFITTALNTTSNPEDNATIVNLLTEMSSLNPNAEDYINKASAVYEKINAFERETGPRNGLGILRLASNPKTMSAALNYIKNVLEQKRNIYASKDDIIARENVQMLDEVLKNFGDPTANIRRFKNDNTTIIGIYLNNNSSFNFDKKFEDDVAWNEENIEDNYRLVFDRTGAEQTIDESANEITRQILSGIPSYTRQGRGEMKLNRLGLPVLLPFKVAIAKVVKTVGNRVDLDEIYNALSDAATTDKEIRQVLNLLGQLGSEETTMIEQKQWGALWQSVSKATNNLRFFSMTKEDNVDAEEVTYKAVSGRSRQNLRVINSQWRDNFKFESERNDTFYATDEAKGNERYLDASDLGNVIIDEYSSTVYIPRESSDSFYHEERKPGVKYKTDPTEARMKRWQADPFSLLKTIGIELPETHEVRDVLIKGSTELGIEPGVIHYIVNSIINRTKAKFDSDTKIYELTDLFKSFTYRDREAGKERDFTQPDVSGYYNQLQQIVQALSDEHINFSGFNVKGDRQSEKTKHSSLTVIVNTLNNAKNYDELLSIPGMEGFDYETNPWVVGSTWFRQMFNLDKPTSNPNFGKRNPEISITTETLSGSQIQYDGADKGVAAIDSDEKTKFITDFHLTLDGKQEILRSEAKSTSHTVYAPLRVRGDNAVRKGLVVNNTEVQTIYAEDYNSSTSPNSLLLYNQFVGNLEAELIRINRIDNIKKKIESRDTSIKFDPKYLMRGSDFFMFDLLLPDALKSKLKSIGISESFTLDNVLTFAEKKQVEKSLKEYFDVRAEELMEEKGDQLVIGTDILEKNRLTEQEEVDSIKQRLMKVFVINNFINNINYSSLFLGDPALYNVEGEDFHKRIAGLISTGDLFRFDTTWYSYINSPKFEAYGFAKKNAADSGQPFQQRSFDGHLNTGIIKESTHDSVYKKHYADIAGISESDYEGIDEADASGFISFDSYRLLSISSNEWSDEQESLYQSILKGESFNPLTISTTFPIRKYQYYGDVSNQDGNNYGLQMKAFHKYSLAPIVPTLIAGTPLEQLHKRMMNSGVDYVTMESGSKLSTIISIDKGLDNSTADVIYDQNRKITDAPFTVNKIHIRGLKSQIKVGEGYKGYITLPTQWRKMVMLGVMNGQGIPTDYSGTEKQWSKLSESQKEAESKNYKWLNKFERILSKMQVVYKEDLLRDIGMKQVSTKDGISYEGDTKLLVKYIQKQLKNEDMLPEEVQFIMKPDGSMIDDLSLSLNSEKIEKILTVMVDKKLRRVTVNGAALVQMPGAMQESLQFEKPSDEVAAMYGGTNGLKAYYLMDENGSPLTKLDKKGVEQYVVSKMEVKISLQGDFKNLLYLTHSDGEQIAVYNKKGSRSIIDFDSSLQRLNESIANPEWFKVHEKMLTLSGPRIPTQQENTLEAAVVKEFLPPYAGNMVILPSEIVAKAGSDFDYDKLFLMFPNITNINGTIKLQEYGEVSESFDDLYEDIEAFNIVLNQEYQKRDNVRQERSEAYEQVREVRQEVKRINADAFDMIDRLKEEREVLMQDASDAYKAVGKYAGISREEQHVIHRESSPRIQEITDTLDIIYERLDEAFNDLLATRSDLGSVTEIKERFEERLAPINTQIEKLKSEKAVIQEKISQKGIGGLENQLLDAFQERITMGNNFPNLVKTNNTSIFTESRDGEKSLVEQADSFVRKSYNKYNRLNEKPGNKIGKSTIFDYRYNLLKHQENSVGMDALGIAAIAATYYALFSRIGAKLNSTSPKDIQEYMSALEVMNTPGTSDFDYERAKKVVTQFGNYRLKFDHNKVKDELGEHIALGFLKNVEGLSISEVLGQLINGYVDVAKDPWIFKIQGNKQNTPALLFMSMAGMSTKDIIYFTSMPMVVEYNRIKAEMGGVFSDLNYEVGKTPIISASKIVQKARQEMFKKYSEAGIFRELKRSFKPSQYKEIANMIQGNFDAARLKELGSSKPSFEAFQALTHYFEIEDMGNDMTEFQSVTKFDTQKISSISEAQERIDNTKALQSRKSAIPNQWFKDIENTSVGIFNNDQFVVDMFSRYFGLRNNPIVIKGSLSSKIPKGAIRTVVHNDFKNDFLSYLYQNSLFSKDVYARYKLQQSADYFALTEIDEENKVVTYGLNHLQDRKDQVTQIIAGPNGFINDMSNMFPTDSHFLRFEIELQKIERETEGMSDLQILEYFDYANSYSSSTGTPIGVKYKMALYRSDNNIAMFDFRMGMASILKKIIQRNPSLREQYSLINDLRYDYNTENRKSNMWLSEVKDPEMARIYIDNLRDLKNHADPFIAEFFSKFENMIIMQTGMNRRSKYDMANLIDQSMFKDVIENGIGVDRVLRDLRNVEVAQSQGQKATSQYLSVFEGMFDRLVSDEQAWRLRVRGTNYMTDKLEDQVETAVLSRLTYNNVSIVNNFNDVPAGTTILEVEDLYDDVNGGLNQEYISSIQDKPIYIRDQKLVAPEGESQIELDAILKTVFGVSNSGRNPSLIALSIGQTNDNLSIATAEGLKMKHAHIDETMANESHKAIGKATLGAPLYRSSSQMYVDEINRKYSDRLAGDSTGFKSSDKVWIFGSGIFENAYKGIDGGKDAFEAMVSDTFDSYHKKMIDKAVKANVASFYVGNSSGVDKLAQEYLAEKGYSPIVRYGTVGKYNEYMKDPVNASVNLYDVSRPTTSISNMGLSFLFDKELSTKINTMNEEDLLTSSPYEIVKSDIVAKVTARFPNNESRRYNFFRVLSENPGAISVGESNYSALMERILMEFRGEYNAKEQQREMQQGVAIRQKKVDIDSLPEVTVALSEENMMKVFTGEKTSTVRGTKGFSQLGLDSGESGVFNIGGVKYTITNRGLLTIDEAGGKDKILQSEGLPTEPTRKNIYPIEHQGKTYYAQFKQTASWMNPLDTSVMAMYVYDIAPAKGSMESLGGNITSEDINNLEKDC